MMKYDHSGKVIFKCSCGFVLFFLSTSSTPFTKAHKHQDSGQADRAFQKACRREHWGGRGGKPSLGDKLVFTKAHKHQDSGRADHSGLPFYPPPLPPARPRDWRGGGGGLEREGVGGGGGGRVDTTQRKHRTKGARFPERLLGTNSI